MVHEKSIRLSLAAGLLAVCVFWTGCKPKMPELPPRKKMNVEVWVVEPTTIREEVTLPGIVRADKTVRLSAEVSALVKTAPADVGDTVSEGEVLLTFDDTDLVQIEKQGASAVASLEARLAEVKKGARDQQVRDAEAMLRAAKAGLDLAQTIAERRRKLSEEKVIPLEVLDQARMQLKQAQAQYERAKEMVDLVLEGATEETKRALEAQLEGAKAAQALAANRLKKTVVKSPFKGIVIKRFMDEGEFTGPGAPLFDIIPETPVKVSLGVPERIFGKLKKGDAVGIAFPGLDLSTAAKITMLAPAANPQTQTFTVEIALDNPVVTPDPRGGPPRRVAIRPGLIVDIRFLLGLHEGEVSIPNDALILEGEALFVYVVEEMRVKMRPVMIGIKREGFIQITEGLAAGDRLVIEGQKQVRDGDEFNLVKEHTGPLASSK
ncbi:MAG: efflux RND transporter periplasmic adaptor subunit [Planctomycetota bacterium]